MFYYIIMTAWTDHVKNYAKAKGITYAKALKDPACSASYKRNTNSPSYLTGKTAKKYVKQNNAKEALLKLQESKLKRSATKKKFGTEPEPNFGVSFQY